MLDVTIMPRLTDRALYNKSATVQHAVATDGYNSKYLKHSTLCTQNGFDFLPISFESSGACHPSTLQFIKILANKHSEKSLIPRSILINYSINLISAALHMGEAISV